MSSQRRLPNKRAREQDQLLRRLGYRMISDAGGHFRYEHPGQPPLIASATPAPRAGAWLVKELKRRHHDHPVLLEFTGGNRSRPASRAASQEKARRRSERRPKLVAAVISPRPAPRPSATPAYTGCSDCGRRWLSDLDPTGRLCPNCGGQVVLGREAA